MEKMAFQREQSGPWAVLQGILSFLVSNDPRGRFYIPVLIVWLFSEQWIEVLCCI